jgi:hypothetical protein
MPKRKHESELKENKTESKKQKNEEKINSQKLFKAANKHNLQINLPNQVAQIDDLLTPTESIAEYFQSLTMKNTSN